jgi:tRNA modification GTPase
VYDDTIAAIATAAGEAGIGVVRLSGPDSLAIGRALFRPSARDCAFESHRLYHGRIVDGAETVDEVLLAYMKGPRSYTAEDVVEVHGHGGTLPLERILHLALAHGARLANPGEFTLRAFLNGRLDLTRAEAVADVIQARSDASLRLAVNQLSGRLASAIDGVRRRILGVMTQLEANIDFSEDDVPPAASAALANELSPALDDLCRLLRAADEGILYRRGARVAIAGQPNAGKSSLLNALLRTSRAIVTPIAGTTRDTIEESINLAGLPVVLVDTAGITETADPVEAIGVGRSRQAIAEADLVLFVYDAALGWQPEDEELLAGAAGKPTLLAANKCDLVSGAPACGLPVSAITGDGLTELERELRGRLAPASSVDDILVNNLRHKTLLEDAAGHVRDAIDSLRQERAADFVSIDLRAGLAALGAITGDEVSETLLDEIFSRFCIGK